MSLTFLFPASIKTQWHTNGFLNFPGAVVIATEDFSDGWWSNEPALQARDYLTVALSVPPELSVAPASGTFETRFFLNETQAPAPLLALGNPEASRFSLQLRKEQGQTLVAEFYAANTLVAKLSAHTMIAAGEWLELAVVYEHSATDLQRARLYLNGECLAETKPTGTWRWPEAATLYLGGFPGSKTFSGKLDEVRLSTTARYHEASYPVAQTLVADGQTLGLWNFEQETATPLLEPHWRANANGARLVELKTSRHRNETILVEWHTAYEQGLEGFVIERREAAATGKFERCGYMPALGTSQYAQQYRFVDTPPERGVYYYRLRALDPNGNCGYSYEVACEVARAE